MIMMNELILSYSATHNCLLLQKLFHSQNSLVMDGSDLKHCKHPDYKTALEGTFRCQMHAFIFLT